MNVRRGALVFTWLALLVLGGCGAGLVTGVVASDGGNGNTQPPSLSLPDQAFPLVPVPTIRGRTVVVANASLTQGPNLRVQLRVHAADDPGNPVVVAQDQTGVRTTMQSGSTVVGFDLDTTAIVQQFGTREDRAAWLAVLDNGRLVGPPVRVLLLQQPTLRLFDGSPLFLSPLGQAVRFACTGLASEVASGLQVLVTTVDATGVASFVTRPCLGPTFVEPGLGDPPLQFGERLVTVEVPGNTYSGPATFLLDDIVAGRSEPSGGAYYRPEIIDAAPAQGSTGGGTEVTLNGSALAPLVTGQSPGVPDFDRIELLFQKGGRELPLPDVQLLRARSTFNRLVFRMPYSPDGRPGDVAIVLRVRLQNAPDVVAEVIAEGEFLFANPVPVFSPRGIALSGDPIALAPIALEGAPNSSQATDFAVLYAEGNYAAVQLLLAQENGMFIRYGSTLRVGDPAVAAEGDPRSLLTGDFDGDQVPDLFVLNGGAATAIHHVILGQAAPLPPLGRVIAIPSIADMDRGRVADFDRDGRDDLLLLPRRRPGPAQRPVVLLQRSAPGAPAFASPIEVPVAAFPYDAFEVADLDGDNFLDVAVVAAGMTMQLDVVYGDGAGGFQVVETTSTWRDCIVPGYFADAGSPAAGLHALGPAPRSLVLVLSGLPAVFVTTPTPEWRVHPTTPPLLVHRRPDVAGNPRSYRQASPTDVVLQVGAIDPFRTSIAVNLDSSAGGIDEVLVGTALDKTATALGFFRLGPLTGTLGLVSLLNPPGVFTGKNIRALFTGIAFPANPQRGQAEVPAVFIQHEATVDGAVERRLSTLLKSTLPIGIRLELPDVGFGIPLQGVVGGRFTASSVAAGALTPDLAVPSSQRIQVGDNNGFGALAPGNRMSHGGLVPESTTRIAAPAGVVDSLVFLDDGRRDSRTDRVLRLGVWTPRTGPGSPDPQFPTAFSGDLRPLLPPALADAEIDAASRLQATDVDGDLRLDLVTLLRFVGRRGDSDAVLMFLRGRGNVGANEFPFEMPVSGTMVTVHGSASSFALADFAVPGGAQPRRLELALAVPEGAGADVGNHVRFYRLVDNANGAGWQRSFAPGGAQVLIAGNAPTQLAADDFDGDGNADLLVAADDELLRLFLHLGAPAADPLQVAIDSFEQMPPQPTSPGRQTNLLLGDINGDGNVDALLTTEFTTSTGELTTSVAFYLSSGTGVVGPTFVSPTRVGSRNSRLAAELGDINSDGVPDLALGWFQVDDTGDNLRVLLGGSR